MRSLSFVSYSLLLYVARDFRGMESFPTSYERLSGTPLLLRPTDVGVFGTAVVVGVRQPSSVSGRMHSHDRNSRNSSTAPTAIRASRARSSALAPSAAMNAA